MNLANPSMVSAQGLPISSSAHNRKDSAFPQFPSSSTLESTNGQLATEPQCSEYFHINNRHSPPCETRPCMGKHHAMPYYICIQCIKEARSWYIKGSRRRELRAREPVISESNPVLLCQNCTAAGSQDMEPVGQSCACMDLTTGWFCFECADVHSWAGKLHAEGLGIREEKAQTELPRQQQAYNICPGCEDVFVFTDTSHHASMCMICKDILADEPLEPTGTTGMTGTTGEVHMPSHHFSRQTGAGEQRRLETATKILRQKTMRQKTMRQKTMRQKTFPPKDIPIAQLQAPEIATNNAAPVSGSHSPAGESWNFPRSSAVSIGPPIPGATADSDAKVRYFLRLHFNGSRCMLGEHRRTMDHESCRCDKLRRKGDIKRFIDELTETEEADNKELGIDVVLGLWFRQNRNL